MTPRLRRATLILLGVVAVGVLTIGLQAGLGELSADFFPRRAHPQKPTNDSALADLREIVLPTARAQIHAWYLPPRNGAVIVLLHGTSADRTQLLPEAHALAAAGYGVLLPDFPGHGDSTGRATWAQAEDDAARAAVDHAVGPAGGVRVGLLGFSNGSMIAVQEAASDPRVGALVLTGAIDDPDHPIAHDFRRWGPLSAWPAVWAAHLAGMDSAGRRPLDLVARLAPRPLLIVSGSADPETPPACAAALLAAAREPKTLWTIEGAGHGNYAAVAGPAYGQRLVQFFDDAFGAMNASHHRQP